MRLFAVAGLLLILCACSVTRKEASLGRRSTLISPAEDGRILLPGTVSLSGAWFYAAEEPETFALDTSLILDRMFYTSESLYSRSLFVESRYAIQGELFYGATRFMSVGLHSSLSYGPLMGLMENYPGVIDEQLAEWGFFMRFHIRGEKWSFTFRPDLLVARTAYVIADTSHIDSLWLIVAAGSWDTLRTFRKTFFGFNHSFTLRYQPGRLLGCYAGFNLCCRPWAIIDNDLMLGYETALFMGLDFKFNRNASFGVFMINPTEYYESGFESPWQIGGKLTLMTSWRKPEEQER